MSVNDLTINQAATLINALNAQARVGGSMQVTDTASFVSCGQTLLKQGYDVVLNAISQVLTQTIFSVRPYEMKFNSLRVDNQKFGNISRKLNIADSDFENGEFDLPADGSSVDQYKIKRAPILQVNFYGANNFTLKAPTYFKNQLNVAFSSPDELVRFWGMITQNAYDQIQQAHENLARATVTNYIAGKIKKNENVYHLLTEYNTAIGQNYSKTDIMAPDKYPAFMQWVYARIQSLSELMTERSQKFHTNITGKAISRHTPKSMQKVYLLSKNMFEMDARVLADKYHVNFLTYAGYQPVNYWQNIDNPDKIKCTPVYLNADGSLTETKIQSAVAGEYILTLSGTVATNDKITIDGTDVTVGSTQTIAGLATQIVGTTFTHFTATTVTGNNGAVKLTAKSNYETMVPEISTTVATLIWSIANIKTGVSADTAVDEDDVFGVVFDEETMGYTVVDESVDVTPINAAGKYFNIYYHFTDKYWTDYTENGFVLMFD